jgi:hypothetical protein
MRSVPSLKRRELFVVGGFDANQVIVRQRLGAYELVELELGGGLFTTLGV